MKQKNILVVDDEPKILEVVASFLESQDYQVFQAENGAKAFEIFEKENISLIILDLMLPDITGEEICKKIRKTSRVPIIMLTAKVEENNLLEGLEIGADDYITKPFRLKELLARVKAVLRRTSEELVPLFNKISFDNDNLIIDFGKDLVLKNQSPVNLTPTEFNILSALIKYPGKVFTREELIEFALGSEFEGFDRAVDSHIKNLRQKIEDNPRTPKYVLTIHGKGYKFGGE
ncbi:response regulator transcription factor [Lachnoclostridium phytofermentans]|uniref:Stage 0 sporulation protein A homolog n=1 Tax=Lachnoclostridium phytofermentans (strain ATCC 700394 / DSM 18823 / ISDg) TaxID=357809 RepID=A9KJ75_LACP7|nr:response regulator transcription factor [Lachnoclostridium phytofermentans]ABX42487.1 two component transcriptional regulator, winged helix family [Lachnoclostridium phytofermentans ISDg]